MRKPHHARAFSLVELSIVLVILGLLVGGVLSGQALIRAAQLRNVATEYNKFFTASHSFKDKYFAIPGDMTNATAFWGFADNGDGLGSDCRDAQTNDRRTCNGNGNGLIANYPDHESTRFWQHLTNAGLIEGNYLGTTFNAVTLCDTLSPGCLFPGSKSGRGLWLVGTHSSLGYTYSYYWGKTAFYITVNYLLDPNLGFNFTPEEAWNIDTKLDDGRPGLGKVMASRTGQCDTSGINATDDASRNSALYRLTNRATECVLFFTDPF